LNDADQQSRRQTIGVSWPALIAAHLFGGEGGNFRAEFYWKALNSASEQLKSDECSGDTGVITSEHPDQLTDFHTTSNRNRRHAAC
jgi:hypothetical protein